MDTFSKQPNRGRRWTFADCEYSELSRQLLVGGELVRLEAKPLDVLQHLLEHPTEVITKDQLIGAAWGTAAADQSLTTAISKLRKAFGGERDRILVVVSGVGYRMAVPVGCRVDLEPGPAALQIRENDTLPGNDQWIAVRRLSLGQTQTVWLAQHSKTREAHVFKFAVDGLRLRALQREVTLARIFRKSLHGDPRFVRIVSCQFEHAPFFIESEYQGVNLFEFAGTDDFERSSLEDRIALAAEICSAVGVAHGLGVLHNDLKPSNILIARQPDSPLGDGQPLLRRWQVRIVDFGVASLNQPEMLEALNISHHGEFEPGDKGEGVSSLEPVMKFEPS